MTTNSGAAARRVFRSKVDSIRPTYGFEDVSLAPGTSTVEPADVDLSQTFAGIPLAIPVLAAAMDAVVDGRIVDGDVIVIRYEGPVGGPGMQEMLSVTAALVGEGMGEHVALLTDGRFEPATPRPAALLPAAD